jgi:D-xylose transport system ATP-binding protein
VSVDRFQGSVNGANAPMLRVSGVSKWFGAVRALSDVSLELKRGEVLGLLGDNGAGKSTLIKCISGVYKPDKGEIFIDGELAHMRTAADARGRGIETVYQDLALFDNLTAPANFFAGREETIWSWLGPLAIMRDRSMSTHTADLIKRLKVNVPERAGLVGLMSGGQRQSIAVARAAAFASKVVILDEPTAALGIRESQAVLDVVRELPGQGVSVIMISHNLDHIMQVCDRAVVMRRGRVVGEDVPSDETHERLVGLIVRG